jgi:hypothetical protein
LVSTQGRTIPSPLYPVQKPACIPLTKKFDRSVYVGWGAPRLSLSRDKRPQSWTGIFSPPSLGQGQKLFYPTIVGMDTFTPTP